MSTVRIFSDAEVIGLRNHCYFLGLCFCKLRVIFDCESASSSIVRVMLWGVSFVWGGQHFVAGGLWFRLSIFHDQCEVPSILL